MYICCNWACNNDQLCGEGAKKGFYIQSFKESHFVWVAKDIMISNKKYCEEHTIISIRKENVILNRQITKILSKSIQNSLFEHDQNSIELLIVYF